MCECMCMCVYFSFGNRDQAEEHYYSQRAQGLKEG